MKVYISGQITGLPIDEAFQNFKDCDQAMQDAGHETVNPFNVLPFDKSFTWKDYMKADIKALVDCDAIIMIKGWPNSKGALLELNIAVHLGLKIFHHE